MNIPRKLKCELCKWIYNFTSLVHLVVATETFHMNMKNTKNIEHFKNNMLTMRYTQVWCASNMFKVSIKNYTFNTVNKYFIIQFKGSFKDVGNRWCILYQTSYVVLLLKISYRIILIGIYWLTNNVCRQIFKENNCL